MDKEYINQINIILDQQEIDNRVKPLIKLYFLGKLKSGDLALEQLKVQIETLCSRISNVEFSSNNIVAAYSSKANVLTINKQLFIEGKSDEVILPVFMKFEEALNQGNRRGYANHIEDFIRAGRIAKVNSIPISDRLYKLYEMAEYCYGDTEHKVDELIKEDNSWQTTCSKYNTALNTMIITGKNDQKELLNAVNLFHQEIFTPEAIQDPEFKGPFRNEEYQKKAARVLRCMMDYIVPASNQYDTFEREGLIRKIKLFTGCTEDRVEQAKSNAYSGDSRIGTILESTIQESSIKISEEVIVSKVQAVLARKPNYDARIKHLIIPFFIRSQKIYDWDMDEFQERLNEIDLKIDTIVFEDLENITTMGTTAMEKIKLNSRVFFDKNGKNVWPVEKTLFHELGHNTDSNDREGITSKEKLQTVLASEGGRFYEWTNTVFERLVNGQRFYKKDDAMQLSQSGYEALAPLGSMLSCALGVSEIEFARIKDKGKAYEEKLLEEMFPSIEGSDSPHGAEVLRRVKEIFDLYKLETDFSLSKKRANQNLLNEMYSECLEIMQRRIETELQRGSIQDPGEYKKYQMFLLKKMNFNYKSASKSDGFRFSKIPIVHDIGFCTDNLSRKELAEIAAEQIATADFGFNNSSLEQYSTAMTLKGKKKAFYDNLISSSRLQQTEPVKTVLSVEHNRDTNQHAR